MGFTSYRFPKNERGWNERSYRFLKATLIRSANFMFNPTVVNEHNMPTTGPCFIFGNHANNFDPFILNVHLNDEPTAGVMTRDQFHRFIPALCMDSVGIVPTSKYVPDPSVIRNVMKMVDQKRMIVIYPEGGRRWDGRPKSVIESTMKLFWKIGIPVHPVETHGSYVGWPRWASFPRRNRTRLVFRDPLIPSNFDSYDSFYEACMEAMNFHEETPPAESTPFWTHKPAAGIEKLLYKCPITGVQDAVWSPDGQKVLSKAAPEFEYRMNTLSQLVDGYGQAFTLSPFYDKVKTFPMQLDANGLLIDEPRAYLYQIDRRFNRRGLSWTRAWIHPDHIGFQVGGSTNRVPLQDIRYVSIEQNSRITLTMDEMTWEIVLTTTRALQWQDTIQRLQHFELPEPVQIPFGSEIRI